MQLNSKGIDLIKRFEGCKLDAYLDVGDVPTIGYGMTRYPDNTLVKMGDEISKIEADQMFNLLVIRFATDVQRLITADLNDNQFSALVSFAWNVGVNALKNSTLLKKVNASPVDPTIRDLFMQWTFVGKERIPGLVNRRKADADLYFLPIEQ